MRDVGATLVVALFVCGNNAHQRDSVKPQDALHDPVTAGHPGLLDTNR